MTIGFKALNRWEEALLSETVFPCGSAAMFGLGYWDVYDWCLG